MINITGFYILLGIAAWLYVRIFNRFNMDENS